MRQETDVSTMELPGMPAAKPRGKPGRPRVYATAKDRQEAYRQRKGIKLLTVELPIEVHGDFEAWLGKRGEKRGPVITRLIRSQLLRKR
jgi:hypothetical protein